MPIQRMQDRFSLGEISPLTHSKPATDGFYYSLAQAKNVVVMPQSILKRRFGTEYVDNIIDVNIASEIKLFMFQIGIFSNYVLVVRPNNIDIYYQDVKCASVENPYDASTIQTLHFMQDGGIPTIFSDGRSQPQQIIRSASTPISITDFGDTANSLKTTGLNMVVGQILPAAFSVTSIIDQLPSTIPELNDATNYFIKAVSPTDFEIYSTPGNASLGINKFQILDPGNDTQVIPQNTWTVQPYNFTILPTYDFDKNYFDFEFNLNVINDDNDLVLTCDNALFTEEYVGGLVITPRQALRIETYVSPTVVDVAYLSGDFMIRTTSPQDNNYNFPGNSAFIGVPAFSDIRGWPRSGTFVQSRAVLCSTPSVQDLMCASVTGDSHNFNDTGTFETDGITQNVNDDKGSYILFPYGTKTLTIFTTSGVFSTPYNSNVSFSPGNTKIEKEEESYIEDVQAIWIDNQLFYVDGGGRRIRSLQFDIAISAYQFSTVSTFSEHLIRQPICSAVYRNSADIDVSLVFFINSDGTIACYNTLTEQGIQGWTLLNTDGLYRYAYGARGLTYFVVERVINNQTKFYLEKLDFDLLNDCATTFVFDPPQSVITELDYLEGKEVKVIADEYRLTGTIQGGQITLPFAATDVEIGLSYAPLLETLPFMSKELISQFPVSFYRDKVYSNVYIDYYLSYGIYINNTLIPMEGFGDTAPAPVPQTGYYKATPMQSALQGITITQRDPYPFILRSIGFEVEMQ